MTTAERHHQNQLDTAVARVRNYLATALLVLSVMGAIGTFLIRAATADMRQEIVSIHSQMEVLQLAVTAVVEPENSPERRAAIRSLRERRKVR